VDCVADLLEEHKITDYLIEIGGEVRAKGKKSKEKNWIVSIEKPTPDFSGHQQILTLNNQSLATSGSYLQTISIGDQRISHLMDPRTGLPAQITTPIATPIAIQSEGEPDELVSVAVIAPTCTLADAWATALFVLGEKKGRELANRHGISALFLLRRGSEIIEIPSKHYEKNADVL
jgi:thiamine biosynthesis lipoprotein